MLPGPVVAALVGMRPTLCILLAPAMLVLSVRAQAQDGDSLEVPSPQPGAPREATPQVGYDLALRPPESLAAQVEELRRQRPSIAGPVAAIAVGSPMATFGAAFAIKSARDPYFLTGCVDDCPRNKTLVVGFGALAAAAFTVAIVGTIMLVRRLRRRRELDRRIRALQTASVPRGLLGPTELRPVAW